MSEVFIAIVSCIALSASLVASALWWDESKRIDELEMDISDIRNHSLMAHDVIRRIYKKLDELL